MDLTEAPLDDIISELKRRDICFVFAAAHNDNTGCNYHFEGHGNVATQVGLARSLSFATEQRFNRRLGLIPDDEDT